MEISTQSKSGHASGGHHDSFVGVVRTEGTAESTKCTVVTLTTGNMLLVLDHPVSGTQLHVDFEGKGAQLSVSGHVRWDMPAPNGRHAVALRLDLVSAEAARFINQLMPEPPAPSPTSAPSPGAVPDASQRSPSITSAPMASSAATASAANRRSPAGLQRSNHLALMVFAAVVLVAILGGAAMVANSTSQPAAARPGVVGLSPVAVQAPIPPAVDVVAATRVAVKETPAASPVYQVVQIPPAPALLRRSRSLISKPGGVASAGPQNGLLADLYETDASPAVIGPRVAGLSSETIARRSINERLPMVQSCYDHALRSSPNLAGRFVVEVIVAVDGTVSEASIVEGKLDDFEMEACVNRALKTVVLTPSAEERVVRVPFLLRRPAL